MRGRRPCSFPIAGFSVSQVKKGQLYIRLLTSLDNGTVIAQFEYEQIMKSIEKY